VPEAKSEFFVGWFFTTEFATTYMETINLMQLADGIPAMLRFAAIVFAFCLPIALFEIFLTAMAKSGRSKRRKSRYF
jgi:hypothetical protein